MVANARQLLVSHWKVDEEARTGSGHVVIRYTISNKRVLISKCIRTGCHPNVYDRSISSTLQKPGKADYSNPRAWRLLHLFSTMSKWIEKSLPLYFLAKHWLTSPNQFGPMPRKSTTDPALCLAHDIYAAGNYNIFTRPITKQDTSTRSTTTGR